MFLTSSCNVAVCLFERYFSILFGCRAHRGCFPQRMIEDALTVFWSIVVWSMHFSALGSVNLWLWLQVLCVMGLWVAACFCFGDLSNCNVLVPGLGCFLPGMMLPFVRVAHVLCWWFSTSVKLTLKFCHSEKKDLLRVDSILWGNSLDLHVLIFD